MKDQQIEKKLLVLQDFKKEFNEQIQLLETRMKERSESKALEKEG